MSPSVLEIRERRKANIQNALQKKFEKIQRNISEIREIRRKATEKQVINDNDSEQSGRSFDLDEPGNQSTKLTKAERLELEDIKNVESEIKARHNLHLARKRTILTQNYNE